MKVKYFRSIHKDSYATEYLGGVYPIDGMEDLGYMGYLAVRLSSGDRNFWVSHDDIMVA